MNVVNTIPQQGQKQIRNGHETRTVQMRSRFFSDSLVFFLKQNSEDVAHLFFVIRFLQDRLWERDICLRGSIVSGKMYWSDDENVTVGPGLIEAYENERKFVIYPRITVSDELLRYIEENDCAAKPFGINGGSRLKDLVRSDWDGMRFLDLLHREITRHKGEDFDPTLENGQFSIVYDPSQPSQHGSICECERVRAIIDRYIDSKDARIRQMHAWLHSYLNQI